MIVGRVGDSSAPACRQDDRQPAVRNAAAVGARPPVQVSLTTVAPMAATETSVIPTSSSSHTISQVNSGQSTSRILCSPIVQTIIPPPPAGRPSSN